ncbi:flavin reductase family protein [Sphingomonas sp. ST-64]|uniref:Flavin reductase family protein n=1 Tax=Sphingomonas plantiphila TaxID=3163295 RepID=A0ABW8YRA3_9SPHN
MLSAADATMVEEFRSAMRRLAASVHVVTARDATGCHGMTVTAACSLSVEPAAMVVCINRSARAHSAMIETGRLCLNLLGAGEEELAARFAGGTGEVGLARFDPSRWSLDAPAGPSFVNALASIDLSVESHHPFSTHTIFACAVDAVRLGGERPALLYANRRYGALVT